MPAEVRDVRGNDSLWTARVGLLLTEARCRDLTLAVNEPVDIATPILTREDREAVVTWFARYEETLPEPVRRFVSEPLSELRSSKLSQKSFHHLGRQLARALGLIPSTERRKSSGRALPSSPKRSGSKEPSGLTVVDGEGGRVRDPRALCHARSDNSAEHLEERAEERDATRSESGKPERSTEQHESSAGSGAKKSRISDERRAQIHAESSAFIARAELGDGEDPAHRSPEESLMNAEVVCLEEDQAMVSAQLPEDASEEEVIKTFTEPRVRYDLAVTVTELQLEVEKKVLKSADGTRRVISGDVQAYGPKGFAVTWGAVATLVVMVAQFAMPLNRLATMLSTEAKRFSSTGLGRLTHFAAKHFFPVYLYLMEQLSDTDILAGDDTSSRVVEVSSYFARAKEGADERPPWRAYATTDAAQQAYEEYIKRKEKLLARRAAGDRKAKKTPIEEPPLKVLIGRELAFESQRKSGDGPKQSLNTTVVTGRSESDDPSSMIVFYRSHLGSLGNLLEMLLTRRKRSKPKLIVQGDLSTTNLVTDPRLTELFDIELVGCTSHARRPFALYEDHDPMTTSVVLAVFGVLAVHEDTLTRMGRNRENVSAVRQVDSRKMWERLKAECTELAKRWTKATPLGIAARYIIKHYDRLTAYLRDPRLEATNNLRERLLRTEKLIEKSSMFRQSVEGRVVLDILRTIAQTAVAAGATPHEYLVDVLKTPASEVEAHPELYTPAAWAKRKQQERAEAAAARAAVA